MEHELIVTIWINKLIGLLAGILGVQVHEGQTFIPQHLLLSVLSTLAVLLLLRLLTRNLQTLPSPVQVAAEGIYQAFRSLIDDVIGHEGRRFLPVLGTLGLFIAVSNLLGLVPEMGAPTSNLNVTAGCALFVFVYYHAQGIRVHGPLGYLKTFAGPVWWLAWLFFPIEVISHFSRPLSLAMRLFGNIFGEDLVIIIIASLVPFLAPLPIMALAAFTSLLQAFIFVMLSSIYLAGAISHEH